MSGNEKKKKEKKQNKDQKPEDKEKNKEEEFWDTEAEPEEHIDKDGENLEEIDPEKLNYTKIKNLSPGMSNVNVKGKIDFVGDVMGRGFGEEPRAIGFIKDDTGEIKLTFWGDDARTAKKGKKIRVIKGFVSEFRGQRQLNPHKKMGVDFLTK